MKIEQFFIKEVDKQDKAILLQKYQHLLSKYIVYYFNRGLFIAAYNVASPESYLIEVNNIRAKEILDKFNNDLD